jgi:hypothetical protein
VGDSKLQLTTKRVAISCTAERAKCVVGAAQGTIQGVQKGGVERNREVGERLQPGEGSFGSGSSQGWMM